jgi:surface protein
MKVKICFSIVFLILLTVSFAQAQVLGIPTNLVVTPIHTGGMIQFTAPTNIGGSTITNYEYSTDNGATWVNPFPLVTESPLIISSGLTNCTTYPIKLRAVNASGSGAASAAVSLTPAASVNMGINCTSRTSATDNGWRGITYGNGVFVTVSQDDTGNRVMTSPDGIAWAVRTSSAINPMTLEVVTSAASQQVTLPLYGSVNVTVDWGDGGATNSYLSAGSYTRTYAVAGTYTITIDGTLSQFGSGNPYSNAERITRVIDWGSTGLTSLNGAFCGATALVDVPSNLPATVTNLRAAFAGASTFNDPDVSSWNTSAVTNMSHVFNARATLQYDVPSPSVFNQNIGGWNTALVTDMTGMFNYARAFNNGGSPTIGTWNTGSVVSFVRMFSNANAFNQPIGTWNTTNVTDMNNMFRDGTPAFNQDVSNWNVSNVTNMSAMFKGASSFNNGGSTNINNWNVSNVTNMWIMFSDATVFNQPLSNWNVAKVTSMGGMFQRARAFNQNIGNWNLIKVNDISFMFFQANAFNNGGSTAINNWNTAAVTTMQQTFSFAYAFNQPIGNWNTNNVTSIFAMFWVASSFNQDIGSWNVSQCTNFQSTFGGAASFNNGGSPSINNWNVSNVTSLQDAFGNTAAFQQPLNNWNVGNVTNMSYTFKGSGFNQNITSWNTAKVTTMQQMFNAATAFNQNIGSWNTAAVTNMSSMFSGASAFNQNIGNWNLNANVNLSNMLNNSGMDCSNYSATLIGWNANPSCPTGRTLGAAGRTYYGPLVTAARANLVLATVSGGKGWTITGDALTAVGAASTTQNLCINTALTNITHATTGATGISNSGVAGANGLPAGVSAAWTANVITISGTPTASGTFNYSIPLTNTCGAINATGTITVNPNNTVGPASSAPTLCINTALTNITHTTTGATGIGIPTGLPAGVSAAWATNTITISGTPTVSGTFSYNIPLTGECGSINATGTIIINSVLPYITCSLPIDAVGTVSDFVGTNLGNLDGTGSVASFRKPVGLVADAIGNIYISDNQNHNIRKITPSGVVTTFAGSTNAPTGISGFVNATGTAARFNYPQGIAIDGFGNLFVADSINNVIRKITPDGEVSTYAGTGALGNTNGSSASATFNYPSGVATDNTGNVYVADAGNNVIRKITTAGIVSNFAGSGSPGITDGIGALASFSCMNQMCADAAENLYLTDGCNYIIRKVTPSGVVSTIAGTGFLGNANGIGTAASFGYIASIAADAAGNIYVADKGNYLIRRITPAGLVSTLAGSGNSTLVNGVAANASFESPYGLTTDPSGNLYVSEVNASRIRKIMVAESVGLCEGDPVVLSAQGGSSYTWSGPQAITNNVTFNSTVSGVFTTTVTNSGACTATKSIFVGQPSQSWSGSISNNWFNASNWSGGVLPDRYTQVTIPPGTANSVVINANTSAYDLTINSGALCTNATNNQLTIYRNLTNNGSFVANNSNVTFLGCNAANTITSASGIYIKNMTIDNPDGAVLAGSSNVTVTNSLNLNNGAVTTGANYLIMTSTASSSLTYGNGFVNGNLRRSIASNASTYYFPVASGTAATDRHLSALLNNFLTGVIFIDASVTEFTMSGANVDANLKTTQDGSSLTASVGKISGQTTIWQFNPNTDPTGGSYGVNLYTENTNLSASDDNKFCPLKRSNNSSYANFLSFDGTTAIPASGAAGRIYNGGNGYAQRTGYTSFSEYIIGKAFGTPLPIELLNFEAAFIEETRFVELKWSTATEINNDFFTVESSQDGSSWTEILRKEGAGTTHQLMNYMDYDKHPHDGTNYYRLKQTDYNGDYTYSKTIAIDILKSIESKIITFPSPVNNILNISSPGISFEEIFVIDNKGAIVAQQLNPDLSENIQIDFGGFADGNYLIKLKTKNTVVTKKITVVH